MSIEIIGKYWRDRNHYGFMLIDLDKLPSNIKNDLEIIFNSNIKKNKSYINSIFIDKRSSHINLEIGKYYSVKLRNKDYYGYSGWEAIDPKPYEYNKQFPDFIPLDFKSNDNFRYFYVDTNGDQSNLHSIHSKSYQDTKLKEDIRTNQYKYKNNSSTQSRYSSRSNDKYKPNRKRIRSRSPFPVNKRYRERSRSPMISRYDSKSTVMKKYRSRSPKIIDNRYENKKSNSELSYEQFKLFSEFFNYYQNK